MLGRLRIPMRKAARSIRNIRIARSKKRAPMPTQSSMCRSVRGNVRAESPTPSSRTAARPCGS